jgi:hypothetical protein
MVFSEGIIGVMGDCTLHFYPKLKINEDKRLKNYPMSGENGEHDRHERKPLTNLNDLFKYSINTNVAT